MMDLCSDPLCGSSETEIYNGEVVCKICYVVREGPNYDKGLLAIKRKVTSDVIPSKKPRSKLEYLLVREERQENRKSPAHHEGLQFIKKSPEDVNGLLELAKKTFNKGVKNQSKKVQTSNERSKMFMPSGKSNSSLFASFASLLYAHRSLTNDWNGHLNPYSNFILLNHKKIKNNQKMSLSAIKSDLLYSFSKLRKLIPPNRRRTIRENAKSQQLKLEINKIATKFIDNTKISKDSLILLEKIENRIELVVYHQQLERIIPSAGLDSVATEILWKILSFSEQKLSRKKLSHILFDTEKRTSDKQAVVKEIILIIELESEFKKIGD